MNAFADAVRKDMQTDKIHLLFNNADIGGGGSSVVGHRAAWERTFSICFHGVINGVRTFLPLLKNASEDHIGTEIVGNSMRMQRGIATELRVALTKLGIDHEAMTDDQIIELANANFRETAPMSSAEAAKVILDGVRAGKWRILVGKDAQFLDECVRADPESAYTGDFYQMLQAGGHFPAM